MNFSSIRRLLIVPFFLLLLVSCGDDNNEFPDPYSSTDETDNQDDDESDEGNSSQDDDENVEDEDLDSNTNAAELKGDIDRGNDTYVLELSRDSETIYFACTQRGGHITEFALNGQNILTEESIGFGWGSTFWTSPQDDWNWPPPSAIESDPYGVTVDEGTSTITLTSQEETTLNVQIVKEFSPDLKNFAIDLKYTIRNIGSEERSFAPWEISRVHPLGLTFFELDDGGIYESEGYSEIPVENIDGIVWFSHTEENIPDTGDYKMFADATGWLAHARDDWLFLKTFKDQSKNDRAPSHGEVEIYTKGTTYKEVENQGAYQAIPSGGEISWNVKWQLRSLPDEAAVTPGDDALLSFVDDLL